VGKRAFLNYTNFTIRSNVTIIQGNLSILGAKYGIACTDILAGTDSDFCVDATGSGITNNTASGKTYLNNTNGIFFSSLFKGLYGLVDNNLTIGNSGVYGINITGTYINISNSGRIVLDGTRITKWRHVNSSVRNDSNIGKIYFNTTLWSRFGLKIFQNISFSGILPSSRAINNLSRIMFAGNASKRYKYSINFTDISGKTIFGITPNTNSGAGNVTGANITIRGNSSMHTNTCMIANKNNGSWFWVCNGLEEWSGLVEGQPG
jgi:hypothetical protein